MEMWRPGRGRHGEFFAAQLSRAGTGKPAPQPELRRPCIIVLHERLVCFLLVSVKLSARVLAFPNYTISWEPK